MSINDPISDMLTRIRNAGAARHAETACPFSKQKLAIAKVLEAEGFLGEVKAERCGYSFHLGEMPSSAPIPRPHCRKEIATFA